MPRTASSSSFTVVHVLRTAARTRLMHATTMRVAHSYNLARGARGALHPGIYISRWRRRLRDACTRNAHSRQNLLSRRVKFRRRSTRGSATISDLRAIIANVPFPPRLQLQDVFSLVDSVFCNFSSRVSSEIPPKTRVNIRSRRGWKYSESRERMFHLTRFVSDWFYVTYSSIPVVHVVVLGGRILLVN